MLSLSPQQVEAAQEFVRTTIETLKTERGVHAETAIAGTARMAGTFLFRSFNFPFEDVRAGQPVLSEQANEKGPRLIQILGQVLEGLGITLDDEKLDEEPDSENDPLLGFLETQGQLEPTYTEIRERLGLSLEEGADSAAAAAGMLIQQSSQILDPNIAFGIAAYGFVEGTKTVPASVGQ